MSEKSQFDWFSEQVKERRDRNDRNDRTVSHHMLVALYDNKDVGWVEASVRMSCRVDQLQTTNANGLGNKEKGKRGN